MNKLAFTALTLLAATSASAGVRIETVARDMKAPATESMAQTILVQDGKVRVNSAKSDGMILKNATIYMLDDKRKSYSEMDKATLQRTMDEAGGAMKEMQEQLKQMPPEQRAQMEKMMGNNMPGMGSGPKAVYVSKDTGRSDTVEGRKCRVWNLLKNGKLQEELCVVPFSSLPGKEDLQKAFRELADAFEGLASSMPGAGDAAKARNAINGYPVRTRSYDDAGKQRATEEVMKSWTEESIPAATFNVPAGYRKEAMPKMGG